MIAAVVLAAGASLRMGEQKLLLPFGDSTVIGHVVDQVIASEIDRTVVVTGHNRARIESALAGRPVALVHNENHAEGMLSSVRCGLAAIPEDVHAFLIVLGDQPNVTSSTVDALIEAFRSGQHGIVVPACGDRTGHPLVVASRFRNAIMSRFDAVGLRGLLREHPGEVQRLDVPDSGVMFDMDTPEDYERERARRNQSCGMAGASEE
ncbi:MAG: nucleotidyltransferase family protein [Candidatus Hydrogenedentes bacterium]|nr:nucleotidyltransferase family protein [Candidatus Hydrogenedentota bacterium]